MILTTNLNAQPKSSFMNFISEPPNLGNVEIQNRNKKTNLIKLINKLLLFQLKKCQLIRPLKALFGNQDQDAKPTYSKKKNNYSRKKLNLNKIRFVKESDKVKAEAKVDKRKNSSIKVDLAKNAAPRKYK